MLDNQNSQILKEFVKCNVDLMPIQCRKNDENKLIDWSLLLDVSFSFFQKESENQQ